MISIPYKKNLTKIGPVSTALILDKEWTDRVKATLGLKDSTEIKVTIFGEEFLVVEIDGLEIKNEKSLKLLSEFKKHLTNK